jgi:hypothetical protein
MQNLDIAYIRLRSSMLEDMEDEEFTEWLECDDCCTEDYHALMVELEKLEMYERMDLVGDFILSF